MKWLSKLFGQKQRKVEYLIDELKKDDLRNDAFTGLIQVGEPAVDPLIAALLDSNSKVRDAAAQALGRIGNPRAVEPLIAALDDKDELVPQAAARALGQIKDIRAVEPLIAALKSKNLLIRQPAAESLGQIGDVRAVKPLIAAIKEGLPLGKTPPGIEEFDYMVYIAGREYAMRQEAAAALETIGDGAVEHLIVALKDESSDLRGWAAVTLGQIGDARAIEPLIALLENNEKTIRQAATVSLEKLGWRPNQK